MRTARTALATAFMTVFPFMLPAQTDTRNQSDCIQQAIETQVKTDLRKFVETRELQVQFTNTLPFAVGAIYARFRLFADDRTIPLDENIFDTMDKVPGGLLPGESMTAKSFHFMDDRATRIAKEATTLKLDISFENLADDEMRALKRAPRVSSWSDTPSPHACQLTESAD